MSNKYFSYSFQIHRTRKNIIIFLIVITISVGAFFLFYRSRQHIETMDKLKYKVVMGMNEFEDTSCDKIYRMSYKESTCGTICINKTNSNKEFLTNTKANLEENGFIIEKIKTKTINKSKWDYFTTVRSKPTISYYAINYDDKLYSIEVINQSTYLTKTKAKECNKNFDKMIASLKIE